MYALVLSALVLWVPFANKPQSIPSTKINLACGIPPIPPIGCQVGACVCDENRNNCQWTFVCQ